MTRMFRSITLSVHMLISVAAISVTTLCRADIGKIEFNRDIRPILSENCFACHGPDRNQRRANLRLDQRDSAMERGVPAPGHPEKSGLIARINAKPGTLLMPPESSHKKLTDTQKQLLTRWIKEGAEYQPHWAYIVPKRPAVPAMKSPKRFLRCSIL